MRIDEQPVLDDAGFLIPPTADPLFAVGPQPQPVMQLLESRSGWVLLGPGGVGKSTVMEQLAAADPDGLWLDLDGLDKAQIRAELGAAAGHHGPVYIDSLDVVAQQEPDLYTVFRRVLRDTDTRGIWRLACRPAAWRVDLDQALADLYGDAFQRLQLLPLSESGAEALLTAQGIAGDRFLPERLKSGTHGGSLSPQTLLAMARRWHATGELPSSQAEAIRYEVERLLDEHRSDYRMQLSGGRRRRVAARLAAFAVFGGGSRFAVGAANDHEVRTVNELPDTPEPDDPARSVTVDEYREVLGSALFVAAPHAALTFSHQQYAEFLAADYLRQRLGDRMGRSPERLASMLGIVAGVIPSPLTGVAAWLCSLAPDACAALIPANARALMASGVDLPDPVRASILDATFVDVADGDLEQFWGFAVQALGHPDIEDQIVYLLGAASSWQQVWWLSRVARATIDGVSERLGELFLPLVHDKSLDRHARTAAVAAVAAIGSDEQKLLLRSFMELPENDDPDDEILAVVIRALYPRLLETAELLRLLRPRRNRHLVGGYLMLLGKLPGLVPLADLPMALQWVAQMPDASPYGDDRGRFVENLVDHAWSLVDQETVRHGLAVMLAAMGRHPYWDISGGKLPWADEASTDLRRRLAVDFATRIELEHDWQLLHFRLLTDRDGDWLLDTITSLPVRAQRVLAQCLSAVLREPTTQQTDRILSLPADHPGYEATRSWRDPIRVDSPQAISARRLKEREEHRRNQRRQADRQALEGIQAVLDEEGDINQWWRAVSLLQSPNRGSLGDYHDLTKTPLWTLLDSLEQAAFQGLGLRYIQHHRPAPRDWIGHTTVALAQVDPDWAGVYLLTTLTRHDPGAVRALPTECWRRWALTIIATWINPNSEEHLRGELLDLVAVEARSAFVEAALTYADLEPDSVRLIVHPIIEALCPEMAQLWVEGLVDERYPDSTASALIELLARHTPIEAATACRHVSLTRHAGSSEAAWRQLARLDPDFVIDHLHEIDGDRDLQGTVPYIPLDQVDDERLCTLAGKLLDRIPYADDPNPDESQYGSGPYSMRRTRDATLTELAKRGLIDQLDALQARRDQHDREVITTFLRRARVRRVDVSHQPVKPQQLLALLARGDARLVRSADDLMAVAIEQLCTIQHEISTGRYRDLWNTPTASRPTPKSEDDISDWLKSAIEIRMNSGILVDREVQVERPKASGIGNRIDLAISAPTQPGFASARLIVEAKLLNNREVRTSLTGQLVDRYLVPTGLRHGIYLIYWVNADHRPTSWSKRLEPDQQALVEFLFEQSQAAASTGLHVRPFILDISLPAGWRASQAS